MMKNIFLTLLALCVTISVLAQDEYISNSRYDIADCFGDLEGRGGVLLISKKNDLVITVSDKDAEVRPARRTSDMRYAYEIVVNRNNDVKVEVSHRGEVFSTEFVVGKKHLKENVFLAYLVEDVERPIQQNEQSKQTKVVFDETLAAVEIISSIEDLQIDCPELLARGAKLNVDNKISEKGTVVSTLTIPLKIISDAKAEVVKLESERDSLNKILLDPNTPQIEKTEERWNRVDWLDNIGIKEKESLVESLTHISVYGKGTNRLDINIDKEGKLAPRKTQSYAILLMKTIEKVHVSECAGYMAEGGRLFGLREYENARAAFEKALKAKDTSEELKGVIRANIAQCDTCAAYTRYALGAFGKIREMREQGNGVQSKVVDYASAGIEYLQKLNRYNPTGFYDDRIAALEKLIRDMPLQIRFTLVRWVSNEVSLFEAGRIPRVEVYSFTGTMPPLQKEYKTDGKFANMIGKSNEFHQMGVSGPEGQIDIELDRNKLPTGFFFRPLNASENIKIQYFNIDELLKQSKGTYNKRLIRVKMFAR